MVTQSNLRDIPTISTTIITYIHPIFYAILYDNDAPSVIRRGFFVVNYPRHHTRSMIFITIHETVSFSALVSLVN
jgi:hypothetical protein